MSIPLRKEERGENQRTSAYSSGGTYSTGGNNYASGGNDSVVGSNSVARTVSLHTEAKSGLGHGSGLGKGQGLGQGLGQGHRFAQGPGLEQGFGSGRSSAGGQGLGQGREISNNHRVVALQDPRAAPFAAPSVVAVDPVIVHGVQGSQPHARKNNQRGDSTRSWPSHGPPAVPFSSGAPIVHPPASPTAYATGGYSTIGNSKSSIVANASAGIGAGAGTSSSSSLPYTSNPYNMSLPPPPASQLDNNNSHNNSSNNNNSHNIHSHNNQPMQMNGIDSIGGNSGGSTSGSTGGNITGGKATGGGSSLDAMDPSNINTCFKNHKVITSWADADDSD